MEDNLSVQKYLVSIEKEENIKILFAVDSGSRSTGLHATSSDFDVRFVFVRPSYNRSLYETNPRVNDVFERKFEKFDIQGWEVQKALKLASNLNGAIFEWLKSGIVYHQINDSILKVSFIFIILFSLIVS